MSRLVDAARDDQGIIADMHWLRGDTTTIVIAGSETVAFTMTMLFYNLTRHPAQVKKLRAELDSLDSIHEASALKSLRHLNAVINETLRLYPPVSTGLLRLTPSEGLTVGDDYIPSGVTISTPLYNIGRLESCYVKAKDFIPERWYTDSMIKDKAGFAPFLAGNFSMIVQ